MLVRAIAGANSPPAAFMENGAIRARLVLRPTMLVPVPRVVHVSPVRTGVEIPGLTEALAEYAKTIMMTVLPACGATQLAGV